MPLAEGPFRHGMTRDGAACARQIEESLDYGAALDWTVAKLETPLIR